MTCAENILNPEPQKISFDVQLEFGARLIATTVTVRTTVGIDLIQLRYLKRRLTVFVKTISGRVKVFLNAVESVSPIWTGDDETTAVFQHFPLEALPVGCASVKD